jgi:hypothetical protein
VPTEFAPFDRRGIIKHSTKVRISDDRNGRRASCDAQKLNEQLEAFWCGGHGMPQRSVASLRTPSGAVRTTTCAI